MIANAELSVLQKIKKFWGFEVDSVSHAEKLASTIGGVLSIFLIALVTNKVTGAAGATLIVPSMGASAVLLFAVPHGKLSQPWALFGGHLISALVGVACYKLVPHEHPYLAAGLAVGLAIGAMHIARCIHPPGGATALAAVIGGPSLHAIGFGYMLSPILLNSVIIFTVAFVFNNLFPWRRYPVSMMRFSEHPQTKPVNVEHLVDKKYIQQALTDMDLVVDMTSEDIQRLFALTLEHADKQRLVGTQIRVGAYYTNGKHGTEWSVRKVINEAISDDPSKDMVIYQVVEGHGLHSSDSCTRDDFAAWAARELVPSKRETK
ncbi:MAG: HPP family protein [Gammaproteobacteria bacterium]|nr:HPP family protein [Gammaproteobacteria bacterium]